MLIIFNDYYLLCIDIIVTKAGNLIALQENLL